MYDELLTKEKQILLGLDAEFICFAFTRGYLYYLNDNKKKRTFLISNQTKKLGVVYGAIYYINEEDEFKLAAYYNNSEYFTGKENNEDIYVKRVIEIKRININSFEDIKELEYTTLNTSSVITFSGNTNNNLINKSIKKGKYYRVGSVDAKYLKKTIEKEKNNGLERH